MINEKQQEVETAFRAAGCFCVYNDELLMMQRQRHKSFEMHWAIPTGKIEVGETASECMARELFEELGIAVAPNLLVKLTNFVVDVEQEALCFEYVSFVLYLDHKPKLRLKRDEVRKTEWVRMSRVRKRRVVPYFYNTFQHFEDWYRGRMQLRLFPFPSGEATSAKRRPN